MRVALTIVWLYIFNINVKFVCSFSIWKFKLIFLEVCLYCATDTSYRGGNCAACHSEAVCAGVTMPTCGARCCCWANGAGAACVVVVMTTGEARRRREEDEVTVTAVPTAAVDCREGTTTTLPDIMRSQRRHGAPQAQGRSRKSGPWRWWHSHCMFTCCTSWIVAILLAELFFVSGSVSFFVSISTVTKRNRCFAFITAFCCYQLT